MWIYACRRGKHQLQSLSVRRRMGGGWWDSKMLTPSPDPAASMGELWGRELTPKRQITCTCWHVILGAHPCHIALTGPSLAFTAGCSTACTSPLVESHTYSGWSQQSPHTAVCIGTLDKQEPCSIYLAQQHSTACLHHARSSHNCPFSEHRAAASCSLPHTQPECPSQPR